MSCPFYEDFCMNTAERPKAILRLSVGRTLHVWEETIVTLRRNSLKARPRPSILFGTGSKIINRNGIAHVQILFIEGCLQERCASIVKALQL